MKLSMPLYSKLISRCKTTPRTVPRTPRTVPRTPRTVPRTPRTVPRTPRTVPRTPRTPHTVPRTPHTVQRTPRTVPRTPPTVPRTPRTVPRTRDTKLPYLRPGSRYRVSRHPRQCIISLQQPCPLTYHLYKAVTLHPGKQCDIT